MVFHTNSIACADATGKMVYNKISRRTVGPADVHIEVSYSGVCHSDIHTAKGEWGDVSKAYPLCVGHEILGTVKAVGASVTKFKVGDIAGVGCFTDSCRSCEECKDGDENLCTGPGGMQGTYGSACAEAKQPGGVTQGGYSGDIVVDESYVIKVPENMHVAAAAPLLCAGITCYSPFINHGIKAGQNLGVVGLGGLGHMAVKIGAAMGCNVTVITRDESKRELALSFGAKNVIISTDKVQMDAAAKSLHFIYNSIAFAHDIHPYLDLLKSNGTMIMVGGVPKGSMPAGSFSLIPRNLRIAGSLIGGIRQTQEMIDFCAKHNIVCSIEMIDATPEAVEIAWKRTVASDVKFRFVIDTKATLPKLV